MMSVLKNFLPLNWNLASTYAAGNETTSKITRAIAVTSAEFKIKSPTCAIWKASIKF